MIATIWRFEVRSASVGAFESAYGPHGDWALLFGRAPGYAGTELLRLGGHDGVYYTIDRWNSEAEFDAAKRLLADDYAALDRRCEAYTSDESWLGLSTICD
ncbi:MAG TPA: hypothetical protein VJ696_07305 [Rhodanobacteraceae bacterium]|nr:hypothetical protein [Rhodanobacteraceae bacterium]